MITKSLYIAFLGVLTVMAADAGEEVLVRRATVDQCLAKEDIQEVDRIVEKLEQNWSQANDPMYFKNMREVCMAVSDRASLDMKVLPLLLRYTSLFLSKCNDGTLPASTSKYSYGASLILRLLDLLRNESIRKDQNWELYRSRIMRLTSIFCQEINDSYILGFKPYVTQMNVAPPIATGEWTMAGMDPKSIKDPQARAAYEAAIKENSRKAMINAEQRILERILKEKFPLCESAIIEAYSCIPVKHLELNEFLLLGGFDIQVRHRIILGVDKVSGETIPLGILPPKEEASEAAK